MRQYWARAWPTAPPLALNCPTSPSLAAPAAPLSSPLLSPSLRSQVANNSSNSSNHNQCKANLKVFSVVNVVKALMGGPKSGSQIKYQLRISLNAYMKWWSDGLMVLEMLFSLLAWVKYGYIDQTNFSQNNCLCGYVYGSDILRILGWIPL